jgi:hypothetical protein
LADNLSFYREQGWKPEEHWRVRLDLACLLGARKIGEFILSAVDDRLKETDYAEFLGHITSSFNNEWAIDFATKMSKKGMGLSDSVYFFCDDRALLKELKEIFNVQKTPQIKHE